MSEADKLQTELALLTKAEELYRSHVQKQHEALARDLARDGYTKEEIEQVFKACEPLFTEGAQQTVEAVKQFVAEAANG